MSGELAGLNAEQGARLVEAVTTIVAVSYVEDKSRRTGDEDRRRSRMCFELVQIMLRDQKWSLTRVIDELPHALRCKLDGAPWEPSTRTAWWGA